MNSGVASVDVVASVGYERAPTVDAAPRAIASWLLEGGVQLLTDPHRGGVAGWVDSGGRAVYVYPEITGYYMQWLAWNVSIGGITARLVHRATLAQRWLAHWIQRTDPPPATRVYLDAHGHDWRNDAEFFFDLAMVVRGVAGATRAGLIEPDEALVGNAAAQLSRLIASDGMFNAYRAGSASTRLPDRWSPRRGGFLASKILPHVGARLQEAAAATVAASLDAAIGQPHDETHPALYAIEGALGLPDRRAIAPFLPALSNQIDILLAHASVDGWLPESRTGTGAERLDVVAQALRVAVLLRARCVDWSPDARALDKMRQLLVRYISPVGALPFAPQAATPQYSVWCAMFAEQALQISKPAVPHCQLHELEAYLV